MNQRELEKHLIFQIFFIVFIFVTMIFTIILLLTDNVSAKQQTSTSFDIYTNYDSPCGAGGSGYCAVQTNNTPFRRSKGSTYNGVLSSIDFYISYVLNSNYQYSINIYSMSTDFRNNNLNVYVYGFNNSNPAGMVPLNYTYSFVSKSQITINLGGYYNYENIAIYMAGSPLTGVNTYGIKKIELVYDDGSTDMSGVIDNQNQNTNDIINNNNSNTEQVVNTITNFFGNICSNFFENSNYSSNQFTSINVTEEDITLTASQTWRILSYSFDVTSGKPYTFYYSSDSTGAIVYYSLNNSTWTQVQNKTYTSITPNSNKIYFRFQNAQLGTGTYVFSNIMLYSGSEHKPYCSPNKPTSKLDDQSWYMEKIRDAQSETNSYLKDDSNPNVDSNGIQNTINSVNSTNPLEYFLTLPTTLINATITGLNSNTCTDWKIGHFGHLGVHDLTGYDFKFPCVNIRQKIGDNIYLIIDSFVAIGILVGTVVKLYHTISNYITLGAEDEVRAQSSFLSPMDFLGNVLGGNVGGVITHMKE